MWCLKTDVFQPSVNSNIAKKGGNLIWWEVTNRFTWPDNLTPVSNVCEATPRSGSLLQKEAPFGYPYKNSNNRKKIESARWPVGRGNGREPGVFPLPIVPRALSVPFFLAWTR